MTLLNWRTLLLADRPGIYRVIELSCTMAVSASDSESSVSGVDVTITQVHLSPFRGSTAEDEFAGQEIPHETPASRAFSVFGFAAVRHQSCVEFVRCGSSRASQAGSTICGSGSAAGWEMFTSSIASRD